MADRTIDDLVKVSLESMRQMVDVDTIIGAPVEVGEGTIIIPVSKVSIGFAAGGVDFGPNKNEGKTAFGGGTGGGMSVTPVAFLVAQKGEVSLLPVEGSQLGDKLIELAPQVVQQIKNLWKKKQEGTNCETSSTT